MRFVDSPRLAALDAIPVIVWAADAQGEREWHNRRYYEYTGLTPEQTRDGGWLEAHHPDEVIELARRWKRAVANETPFETDFRLRGRDGIYRWFLMRAVPHRNGSDEVLGWYGVNIEVEAQKSAFVEMARIAEMLQNAYLPEQLPARPDVRFDAVYLPAARPALIGGDWYDVEELPSGNICISIGDVAGHGIEASIVAGRIRQEILTLATEYEDPALVLRKVNHALIRRRQPLFATAAVAILEKDLSFLRYTSAGHPPPLIAHMATKIVEPLEMDGLPLGVLLELENWNHELALSKGDLLAFYTDGLVEASRNVLVGISKLHAALCRHLTPQLDDGLAERIVGEVLGDDLSSDDLALLLVRVS
jgi:PAS domain S-box-containing protein